MAQRFAVVFVCSALCRRFAVTLLCFCFSASAECARDSCSLERYPAGNSVGSLTAILHHHSIIATDVGTQIELNNRIDALVPISLIP